MSWKKVKIDDKNWKELKKRAVNMEMARSDVVDKLIQKFLENEIEEEVIK